MKVFIIFCAIAIMVFLGLFFMFDYNEVELAEARLKNDANNIGAGIIGLYEPEAYSEGRLVIDDDATMAFIADYEANSSQYGFSDYTIYVFDDSLTYRVFQRGVTAPTPVDFSYATPAAPNFVTIDGEDISIAEPTVLVRLSTTDDFYRYTFLDKGTVVRAAKYIADNRSGYEPLEAPAEGNITEGLLGHYMFAGNLHDSSGNLIDGTSPLGGAVSYGEGITGFGAVFNGSSSVVDMGDSFDMGKSDFALSLWVKSPKKTIESSSSYMISKARAAGQVHRYAAGIAGGSDAGKSFALVSWDSGTHVTYTGNSKIDDDKWHHVVFSFDRDGELVIYVDGKVDSKHDISSKQDVDMDSDNPFRLGAYTAADNVSRVGFLEGTLDNVRVYGKSLTLYEVAMLYSEKNAGLIAWYPLNGSAIDISGNGLDGTVSGATSVTGIGGLAFDFDGVDDFIGIPTPIFEINQTITALIDFSKVSGVQYFLGGSGGHGIRYDGTEFSVYAGNSGYTTVPWTKRESPVLFTITRTSATEYTIRIDNKVIGVANSMTENNLVIARLGGRTIAGQFFRGTMQDVRLYNKALEARDIQKIYDELFDFIKRGLILHYTFEDFAQPATNEYTYPTFDTAGVSGGWSHWGSTGHMGTFGQNLNPEFIYGNQKYSHWVADEAGATKPYLLYKSPAFEGGYRSLQAVICMDDKSPVTNDKVYPAWNARSGGIPNHKWTSIEKIGNTHFYLCKAEGISQDGSNDLVGIYINPGYKVYVSQMQLEQNDHSTPFVDGVRQGSIIDKSGNSNDTLLLEQNSPVWVGNTTTGVSYYRFDGIKQAIGLPVAPPTEFTISLWFYKDSWSSKPWETLIGGPSSDFAIHAKSNTTNAPRLLMPGRSTSQATYAMNRWNHLAWTRTETDSKLYLNGKLVISGASGDVPPGDYFIGSSMDYYTNNYKGAMDDFRIYGRELSQSEIALLGAMQRR